MNAAPNHRIGCVQIVTRIGKKRFSNGRVALPRRTVFINAPIQDVRLRLRLAANRNGWTKMARKPELKPDDPEQSKRFIEIAEEVGADDEEALERAFKEINSLPCGSGRRASPPKKPHRTK